MTFCKNSICLSTISTEMVWFPLPDTAEFGWPFLERPWTWNISRRTYVLMDLFCGVMFDPKFYHSTNGKLMVWGLVVWDSSSTPFITIPFTKPKPPFQPLAEPSNL